jgi:hypothetical protein
MNAHEAERISKNAEPWINEHRDNIVRLVADQDFLRLAAYLCQVIRELEAYREFALRELLLTTQMPSEQWRKIYKALLTDDERQQSQDVAHIICHDARGPCFRENCLFHRTQTVACT